MDPWSLLIIPMLFHLGVCVEQDSACEDGMSCMSLTECRLRLKKSNKTGAILFRCNQEEKNFCCPTEHKNIQVKMRLLPNEICGRTAGTRITVGHIAGFGQYPWMALLGSRLWNGSLVYICGGTLINDRYVLTAAHCLQSVNSTLETVRLGEHNLETEMDCDDDYCTDPAEDHAIEKIIPHQDFDPGKIKNDIALLRLKEKVTIFTDFIKPICLPFDLNVTDKEEKKYEIAGWGKTDIYDSGGSSVLLFTTVFSTPLEDCNPLQSEEVQPLTDTQICAGGTLGEDACKGDSGGPLMSTEQHPNRKTKQYFQIGIVSFGAIPCGAHTAPSVYTKVSKYLDWILDHIDE